MSTERLQQLSERIAETVNDSVLRMQEEVGYPIRITVESYPGDNQVGTATGNAYANRTEVKIGFAER